MRRIIGTYDASEFWYTVLDDDGAILGRFRRRWEALALAHGWKPPKTPKHLVEVDNPCAGPQVWRQTTRPT